MNPVVTLVNWQLQVLPDLWNNVLGGKWGGGIKGENQAHPPCFN